ncbi:MAG TPA: ATP-binding protein [Bacteroidota bacterium]|nr:ATP-binding protein [Bacteroidota bacterium]
MDNPIVLKIELPKIPDIELVALEGLNRLAQHLGIGEEKIGEARILVTEAIINAFEHGSKNAEARVNVEFTITTKQLVIFVRDEGPGFEPSAIEEPKIDKKIGSASKRGWGLKLMKTMSDDFRIESDVNGTRITLTKKLQ